MEYIHYGSTAFDPSKFKPIENYGWIKPKGGFWASPVDAGENGWKEWCEREQFRECRDENSFRFTLSDFARVLHLRHVTDVRNLLKEGIQGSALDCQRGLFGPDFEGIMRQGYDAIELHITECRALYSAMYGWDVDSILIMNPDIIVPSH